MRNLLIFFLLRILNKYVVFFLNSKRKKEKNFKVKKLKILIVKPYSYLDIYSLSFCKSIKTIMSSVYRFGPVGLLLDHNTDFCITDSYNGQKLNYKKLKRNNSRLKFLKIQKKNSIDINLIDFNNYDLVISFEQTVESRIIQKFKKTLWAIIYDDHKHLQYKKSILKKPKYFDIVLNQTLGFTPYSIFRKLHWIDFSYTFGNSNFLNKCKLVKKKNNNIVVEVNQKDYIKNDIKNLIDLKAHCLDESLDQKKYINILAKSKFFLAIDCKSPRWGNSLIEAALSKNLIIGNKNHFWNSQLVLDELHCEDYKKALKIIHNLIKNKKFYNGLLIKQNLRLNYLNYTRPLKQIFDYSINCNRDLNIHKKL